MPRSSLGVPYQSSKKPSSPKFGNAYGFPSPQRERQNLLDQIIINCQKAQSPIGRKDGKSSKNNSLKTQLFQQKQKQNIRNFTSPYSNDKINLAKKQYFQNPTINTCRPSLGNQKQYKTSVFNQNNRNSLERNKGQSQYFTNSFKQINSPSLRFKPNSQSIKPKSLIPKNFPQNIDSLQEIKSTQTNINDKVNQQKIKKYLQQQRMNHIQHCKRQQRKLRLYYIQLQNKLCQLRNKELRTLAEYQTSKLKQYDEHLKLFQSNQNHPRSIQQYQSKIAQINKNPIVRVNQQIKPQVKGCLVTGISGIYFSFQQKYFDLHSL